MRTPLPGVGWGREGGCHPGWRSQAGPDSCGAVSSATHGSSPRGTLLEPAENKDPPRGRRRSPRSPPTFPGGSRMHRAPPGRVAAAGTAAAARRRQGGDPGRNGAGRARAAVPRRVAGAQRRPRAGPACLSPSGPRAPSVRGGPLSTGPRPAPPGWASPRLRLGALPAFRTAFPSHPTLPAKSPPGLYLPAGRGG